MAGILAAACAPAIVRADSLMKIVAPKSPVGLLYRRFGNEWIAIAEVTSFKIGVSSPIIISHNADLIQVGAHRDVEINFADEQARNAACHSGTFKMKAGNLEIGWSKE